MHAYPELGAFHELLRIPHSGVETEEGLFKRLGVFNTVDSVFVVDIGYGASKPGLRATGAQNGCVNDGPVAAAEKSDCTQENSEQVFDEDVEKQSTHFGG